MRGLTSTKKVWATGAGSARPVVSMRMPSYLVLLFSSLVRIRTRSPRTAQGEHCKHHLWRNPHAHVASLCDGQDIIEGQLAVHKRKVEHTRCPFRRRQSLNNVSQRCAKGATGAALKTKRRGGNAKDMPVQQMQPLFISTISSLA